MKTAKIKIVLCSIVVLMAMSLATLAQNSVSTQKTGNTKHRKADNSQQYTQDQQVRNSQNSTFDAGSSADVRHDRTGSLCPGNVSNVGKNSAKSANSKPSTELNGIKQ